MNYHLKLFCNRHRLSDKEKQLLPDIITGRMYEDIGNRHMMIDVTAQNHAKSIYVKCNSTSRAELMNYMLAQMPTHLLTIQLEIRLAELQKNVGEYFSSSCRDVPRAESALIAEAARS